MRIQNRILSPDFNYIMRYYLLSAGDEVTHGAEQTRRYVDRSRRRKDRRAKDLQSALNEENYAPIQPSNASIHTRYLIC